MTEYRLVVTPQGEVALFAEGGDFETGKATIERIFALLEANGIEFAEILPVEQHRHAADGTHVHTHAFSDPAR